MTTTTTAQAVVAQIRALTATELSQMGDSACDNDEAAELYLRIRDEYADVVEELGDKPSDDRIAEIADASPSIWISTKMLELIGTQCYLDSPDLATGNEDILTLAGYALYEMAQLVLYKLTELHDELVADGETPDFD